MSDEYTNTIDYFVRSYTLIIDNDRGAFYYITERARNIIAASGVTATEYRAMTVDGRNEAYAQSIGESVLSTVEEWCEGEEESAESSGGIGKAIIRQVMMYSDSYLAWRLGQHYMPENADIEDFLSDDEDDTDD